MKQEPFSLVLGLVSRDRPAGFLEKSGRVSPASCYPGLNPVRTIITLSSARWPASALRLASQANSQSHIIASICSILAQDIFHKHPISQTFSNSFDSLSLAKMIKENSTSNHIDHTNNWRRKSNLSTLSKTIRNFHELILLIKSTGFRTNKSNLNQHSLITWSLI